MIGRTMTHLMIVPCYNEAQRWNSDYWRDLLQVDGITWLFVNDGSTDNTYEILTQFVGENSQNSSYLSLQGNVGKGEAIRSGWLHGLKSNPEKSGEFAGAGFIDADGAFERVDLERLTNKFTERVFEDSFQSVWSSRVALAGRNIERHASRHYIGRLVATFLSIGGHTLPYDTQSGLKLFATSQEFMGAIQSRFETRWLFEMEIVTRLQADFGAPLKIWEMPLLNWRDVGESKITKRESFRILQELRQIKKLQKKR